MSYNTFKYFVVPAALTFLIVLLLSGGCASSGFYNMADSWCDSHPGASENRCPGHQPKTASWDQENLKRNDHGCPTAIFIAPEGNLVQCDLRIELPQTINYSLLPRFATANEAAVEAIRAVYANCSKHYECGGGIYRTLEGHYIVGPPRTDYEGDAVRPNLKPIGGMTLVAGYHTHPCLPDHAVHLFSPQDIIGAIVQELPAYMGDLCTGKVHLYTPGDPIAVEQYEGIWITPGKIVGSITVVKDVGL
jgi:hypothetical protein